MSSGWGEEFHQELPGMVVCSDGTIEPPSGLHCGPSGRATLLQWFEKNYQLKSDKIQENPGVQACRVWQKTQGFRDKTARSLVDMVKILGIPRNVAYRKVFQDYLLKRLLYRIDKNQKSQESLIILAKRMFHMFQVRQMQPILVALLNKIEHPPDCILQLMIDDTPAAHDFYRIMTLKCKRILWEKKPRLFIEKITPLLQDAFYSCQFNPQDILFFSNIDETKNTQHNPSFHFLEEIAEYIGGSQILYHHCTAYILLKFVASLLPKHYFTIQLERRQKKINENQVEHRFDDSAFFSYFNISDSCTYISLFYPSCTTLNSTNNKNDDFNKDLLIDNDDVSQMQYACVSYWSLLRLQLFRFVKSKGYFNEVDIKMLDPQWRLLNFVNNVITNGPHTLENEKFKNEMFKPPSNSSKVKEVTKSFGRIKSSMDLLDISFVMSNPLFILTSIKHISSYIYDQQMNPLLLERDGMRSWVSLAILGLSSSHVALSRFACECLSLTKDLLSKPKVTNEGDACSKGIETSARSKAFTSKPLPGDKANLPRCLNLRSDHSTAIETSSNIKDTTVLTKKRERAPSVEKSSEGLNKSPSLPAKKFRPQLKLFISDVLRHCVSNQTPSNFTINSKQQHVPNSFSKSDSCASASTSLATTGTSLKGAGDSFPKFTKTLLQLDYLYLPSANFTRIESVVKGFLAALNSLSASPDVLINDYGSRFATKLREIDRETIKSQSTSLKSNHGKVSDRFNSGSVDQDNLDSAQVRDRKKAEAIANLLIKDALQDLQQSVLKDNQDNAQLTQAQGFNFFQIVSENITAFSDIKALNAEVVKEIINRLTFASKTEKAFMQLILLRLFVVSESDQFHSLQKHLCQSLPFLFTSTDPQPSNLNLYIKVISNVVKFFKPLNASLCKFFVECLVPFALEDPITAYYFVNLTEMLEKKAVDCPNLYELQRNLNSKYEKIFLKIQKHFSV